MANPETIQEIIKRLPTADEQSDPPKNAMKISPFDVVLEAVMCRRGFPLRHARHSPELSVEQSHALAALVRGHRGLKGSLFALWGQRGTGKTQIATAAAKEFSWKPEPASPMYAKASDVFRTIRASFRKDSSISEMDVLNSFTKPALLIIDEAQERGETEFEDRVLTHIVDKRYDALLHTVLISNLKKEELAASLGNSIVSRLHETGQAIECNWPSFRTK